MKYAILLSGGMDSVALTYMYKKKLSVAFTVDYGQKSSEKELEVSKKICEKLNIPHEILHIDCSSLGSGEMCNDKISPVSPVPEWWPYRNQLLITLTSMKAISYDIDSLIFGAVKTDNSYIDGTKKFFNIINKLLSIQEGNINVITPAINLTTAELIKKSKIPESLLFWAHSCHISNEPCGVCNGCVKYSEVIEEINKT
ncbi:7-cyano-7-deazaguanine synthase [Mucilaginibacter dorajii]|uniref:7-cyano-7-deazaguanine synthase n=1 Tax=Mucilaginibacter dorajii TaxID=692994 RepID=A0ABP7PMA6_9SPHI|nr:7-cyano-7-deazaguanine synthase [Mucilaginibacter dorajii]MCS3733719.1 7-cyano-7-deazaguanine synthase [Mucilaginibacter dorajii]